MSAINGNVLNDAVRILKSSDDVFSGDFEGSTFTTETRIVLCSELEYILESVKEAVKRDLDPSAIDKLKRSEEYLTKMLY